MGATWKYYITQNLLEVGSSVDVIMPNKYIELTHRHDPDYMDRVGDVAVVQKTTATETVSETAVYLYNHGGSDVSYLVHSGSYPGSKECVAYIVSPTNDGNSHTTLWSQVWVPGGCLNVPPANEWCKITTPQIVLDHGIMTLENAEGDSVTSKVGVTCTTPTAVKFSLLTNDSYIYLDEGKSEIKVDDKPLNTKINLEQGESELLIKDLLTGVTSDGLHTGSSVLLMMPY